MNYGIPEQFISILMGKPHTKIEKNLQNSFWENGKNFLKIPKFTLIWPLKVIQGQMWTERPYIIYYMCFIQTLVIINMHVSKI